MSCPAPTDPASPALLGRVSVITPSLDQAHFLLTNLDSVRAQGPVVREHIVIDGGSRDGSVALLAQRRDRHLRWLSERDQGQSDALNRGLRLCTGDIIGWLNSDDTYRLGAVRRAVTLLDENPQLDMVFGHSDKIDATGQVIGRICAQPVTLEDLLAAETIPQPSCFLRRTVLESVGGLDTELRYAMDYDLWLRLGLLGVSWLAVDEVWACFRLHPASKTGSRAPCFLPEMERSMERTLRSPALPPALAARRHELRRRFHTRVALSAYSYLDLTAARAHLLRAAQADPLGIDRRLLVCLGKSLLGVHLVRLGRRVNALRRGAQPGVQLPASGTILPVPPGESPRTAARTEPPPAAG